MADLGVEALPAFVVDGALISGFDRGRVLAAVAKALEAGSAAAGDLGIPQSEKLRGKP